MLKFVDHQNFLILMVHFQGSCDLSEKIWVDGFSRFDKLTDRQKNMYLDHIFIQFLYKTQFLNIK